MQPEIVALQREMASLRAEVRRQRRRVWLAPVAMLTLFVALLPASLLARDRFGDVPPQSEYAHHDDINRIAEAGITVGCGGDPTRYCPGDFVTRGEMATFLARVAGLGSNPPIVNAKTVAGGGNPAPAPSGTVTGAVGQRVVNQSLAITVHAVIDPGSTDQFTQPRAGTRFVSVDVTVENTGATDSSYNLFFSSLKTTDNFEYDPTSGAAQPRLGSGTQAPGEATRGYITFEVPAGATTATFIYALGAGRIVINLR